MPLYDYQAALHHFSLAQSGEEEVEAPLSVEDFDEMLIAAAGMPN